MQYLKENVEKRLLDAAREVFLRDGFARSSVRDIAAAAGVAVGNLYRYYPGKDALFCAVLRPVTDALEAMLREHHGSSALDVSEMFTERYLRATVASIWPCSRPVAPCCSCFCNGLRVLLSNISAAATPCVPRFLSKTGFAT